MISCEGIGKTIEKAIENALFELKATREDVDIKILKEGGLFRNAKVLVTISEEARPKYEKVKAVKAQEAKEEKKPESVKESKEAKAEPKPTKKTEKKEEKKEEKSPEKSAQPLAMEAQDQEADEQVPAVDAVEFLEGFFETLGRDVDIETTEDEKYRHISVTGEELGDVIGHHGEGYYALNKLVSVMNGRNNKKILLDIGGYREKRAESLAELARRSANKVARSGRYLKLSPMNPSERRIIHTTLQDDDRVTTLSKGTEPHRYVIVFPKED